LLKAEPLRASGIHGSSIIEKVRRGQALESIH
jgi:hypothetical protein